MTQIDPITNITHEHIPLAMKLLGISTHKESAEQLGISTRSLMSNIDEPMQPWRQMSIECLLRRAGQWVTFCKARGLTPPRTPRVGVHGYRCVVCSKCLERLSDADPDGAAAELLQGD